MGNEQQSYGIVKNNEPIPMPPSPYAARTANATTQPDRHTRDIINANMKRAFGERRQPRHD